MHQTNENCLNDKMKPQDIYTFFQERWNTKASRKSTMNDTSQSRKKWEIKLDKE